MKTSPHFFGRILRGIQRGALGIVGAALALTATAQTAPQLVSVTPASGATGVGTSTPLVFVFDQDMDTTFGLIPTIPNALVGNFETSPSTVGMQMTGEWGDDNRTLTVTPSVPVPLNTTITWTLNPTGANPFFQFKSDGGVALATVSGTYSTGSGATGPSLISSTPANNATDVPTNTVVVFRFSQPMEKTANLGGNPPTVPGAVTWVGVDATKFVYTWSADGRQLFCEFSGGFPLNTMVSWVLNPTGADPALRSQAGQDLPTAVHFGQFQTAATTPCNLNPVPDTWGTYALYKISSYKQTSAADPEPDLDQNPFLFSTLVDAPELGPAVTAATLTLPNGTQTNLNTFGFFSYFRTFDSQAELDAAFPAGNYTLRFTQTGQAERVIPMNVPATRPPVPKIINFEATQSWDATQPFTLQWTPFVGATGNDQLFLVISDDSGDVVFQAPDFCVPRELPLNATSLVIPANTLSANETYTAQLYFTKSFYFSTNTVPDMSGFGGIESQTSFLIETTPGGGTAIPATLTSWEVLPSGALNLQVSGSAGKTYPVQRTTSLSSPSWQGIGNVTLNASGSGTFQDTPPAAGQAYFYRALTP